MGHPKREYGFAIIRGHSQRPTVSLHDFHRYKQPKPKPLAAGRLLVRSNGMNRVGSRSSGNRAVPYRVNISLKS